ncbi:O-antigen/teichoic acid export membrane protein [Parabacteroides sp. PFB2-10]|uniref:lipopolysaccharide biosynthesis protein n=1 Tax=Parabacteroides sp. PFB2-10 TaxID=1742405 RepID=UPI0024736F83|nr:polysaccharide biosynthesis protein [Parabacteroides sp. PFB2-10]MDH6312737.1 O-antigen/teichoic acid export membrane protein [Parabacteroides sp. PFB2-10]
MTNYNKIAKNTRFLFFRLIIVTLISLYTSRILLRELGVEAFGLYGLIGGVVAMFGSLRGLFASSIQRFLNFEIGKGNNEEVLQKIFSLGVSIQFLLSIFLVIICEIVGLWLIHNKLIIDPDKITAALWVFHLSILSTVVVMMTIPYDAILIARERMDIFAYLSILDSCLKLGIIFLLPFFGEDKLIVYAVLVFFVSLTIRLINCLYCKSHFKEASYRFTKDRLLFKELSVFAGWNFMGNTVFSLTNEGVNILLNLFGGTALNAARTIAYQVRYVVTNFLSNIQTSSNPQIVHLYAQNKKVESFNLAFLSSKFCFFLSLFVVLPVFVYTNEVLDIWLEEIPTNSVSFVRLILLFLLVRVFHMSFDSLFKAAGKMKMYQMSESVILSLVLPVSYALLKSGRQVEIVFVIMIVVEVVNLFVLLLLSSKMIGVSIMLYLKKVVFPSFLVFLFSFFPVYLIFYNRDISSIPQLILNIVVICGIVLICVFLLGSTADEKKYIKNYLSTMLNKIK